MDTQLEVAQTTKTEVTYVRMGMANPERAILIYWGVSLLLSVVALRDWVGAWNVAATFAQPGFIVYLAITFAFSQVLYVLVARHDDRPILTMPTVIFSLGNGIIETLSFALVYRFGEVIGSGLVGLFAPAAASVAGFATGLVCFIIYGGLIHGLFWMRVLPPHFDDSPRSIAIRKFRPVAEIALVVGWSLCFWLYRDIWTIVAFHILVDLGLMLRVRPVFFYRRALLRA